MSEQYQPPAIGRYVLMMVALAITFYTFVGAIKDAASLIRSAELKTNGTDVFAKAQSDLSQVENWLAQVLNNDYALAALFAASIAIIAFWK